MKHRLQRSGRESPEPKQVTLADSCLNILGMPKRTAKWKGRKPHRRSAVEMGAVVTGIVMEAAVTLPQSRGVLALHNGLCAKLQG